MDDMAAILTINLSALCENWARLGSRAGNAQCAAVVKADAYGLGIDHAVPALARVGCHTFFVAHVSEGIRARAVAPQAVIYVLNGLAQARMHDYRIHRLRPVLGSIPEVGYWRQHGHGCEPAALHVDTGMNRLGLRMEEALALLPTHRLADLGIGLVMTHLASAEVPGAADTAAQVEAFARLKAELAASGNGAVPMSLCNSSGHFLDGIETYDLTRPGYALYGGNPTPDRPNPMREVVTLDAPIVQIRPVSKGEAVGYNGNWVAARDSRIATISCGYADGYPRNAGSSAAHPGGVAEVAGIPCPFAGNVSMDLITLDITDVAPEKVRPGDVATLIGGNLGVDAVAARARTNGYEILTNLGKRYRRLYVHQ